MGTFKDLTGQKFGRWVVLERVDRPVKATVWKCRCDCGTVADVRGGALTSGHSVSCGCYKREQSILHATIHGHRFEKLYQVWIAIKQRCTNPKSKDYPHYGARGIKRCEQWNDYKVFREWAFASGYREGLTIERRDVNGDYCPENCCWVTKAEQGKNTTRTKNNRR